MTSSMCLCFQSVVILNRDWDYWSENGKTASSAAKEITLESRKIKHSFETRTRFHRVRSPSVIPYFYCTRSSRVSEGFALRRVQRKFVLLLTLSTSSKLPGLLFSFRCHFPDFRMTERDGCLRLDIKLARWSNRSSRKGRDSLCNTFKFWPYVI